MKDQDLMTGVMQYDFKKNKALFFKKQAWSNFAFSNDRFNNF